MASMFSFGVPTFALPPASPASNIFIVGRRGSRKECLLQKLLGVRNENADVTVVRGDGKTVEEIEHICEITMTGASQRYKAHTGCVAAAPETLLVLADIPDMNKVVKTRGFRDLILNGTIYNISVIIMSQFCFSMPEIVSASMDYAFAFGDHSNGQRESLQTSFFCVYKSADDFNAVFDVCVDPNTCIVRHVSATDNSASKSVYYYTIPDGTRNT